MTTLIRKAVWGSMLLALVLAFAPAAPAQTPPVVTRVVDGDTIIVSGVGSVRLIGVDTPETVDPRKPVQFFGAEASAYTRTTAQGKQVRLEYDTQRTDKYGRTLAYVYLPDGVLLNAEIIRQGYGHAYTVFPFWYLDEFRAYEREAREAERGLWATSTAARVEATPAAANSDEIVYVTRTGTKYHRAGCRYLARSQIPMALKDAVKQFGPCSVCQPPVLTAKSADAESPQAHDGEPAHASRPPAPQPSAKASAPAQKSGQCQAITKKGTQCSRRAQAGNVYCWQHAR
jgi:micrococcal nuclease